MFTNNLGRFTSNYSKGTNSRATSSNFLIPISLKSDDGNLRLFHRLNYVRVTRLQGLASV